MRLQGRGVSVSHSAFVVQQLAKTPSQPSMNRSCRIAWEGSKGGFPSGTSALREQLSLGGLPEKEMAAHAEAAAALLAVLGHWLHRGALMRYFGFLPLLLQPVTESSVC